MVSSASAQQLSPDRLAAVVTVINMLLLDEETQTKIEFSDLVENGFQVSGEFLIEFDGQPVGIEICFNLNNSFGLQSPQLTATINGNGIVLTEGENCFFLSSAQQLQDNQLVFVVDAPGTYIRLSNIGYEDVSQSRLGLPVLTRSSWGETEVRKVLKIFAFGGHARDAQIRQWADMRPRDAIAEMLNFSEHNLKLSPLAIGEGYVETATQFGKLRDFQDFLSSPSSNLPIPVGNRDQYGVDGYNFDDGYNRMITVRGLNPFRQRIGFWETNYHLAVNLDASVSRAQMAHYYDLIMEAHESGIPYHEVIGVAAKSAAVAMQYGHRRNEWNETSQECDCNEDFAREIHQLFYGIFGFSDPNHENITIKNTAKLLTDMPVKYISSVGFELDVTFETDDHHINSLAVLGQTVSGANASAKIDSLMPISMAHPEAQANLPVMIISVLADDNLNESRKQQLRGAWAAFGPNKDFLEFIHSYATSSMFHSAEQFKYFTSHERALYMANKNNLENLEAYFGGGSYGGRAGRSVGGVVSDDAAGDFFKPLHNVFGGQNSSEASDSALAFEKNYNVLTDDEYRMRNTVQCDACDNGQSWEKKWPQVLPSRADGQYYVADVAAWLWKHAVGSLDNYTNLEKAQLYSLLGTARINPGQSSDGDYGHDFNLLMCVIENYQLQEAATDAPVAYLLENNYYSYCRRDDEEVSGFTAAEQTALNRVWTGQEIANNPLAQSVLTQLSEFTLPLNATTGYNSGANLREHARERVNNALGFIFTTPFVFAEGQ